MKILLFTFYYKPDLCAGSFRTTALVEQLKHLPNVEIEIVTTMPNRYASFESAASKFEQTDNVTIHRIELPSHNSGMLDQIKSFRAYFKAARKLVSGKSYDLVVSTSSRLFTAFLGAFVAKQKQIPLYLDIRDIFVDTIKDVLNPKLAMLAKPILHLVENYTFSKAKHINLVSEGFKPYFAPRFKQPTYSYFTNGIDNEFINVSSEAQCINSIDAQHKKITVLYAGNIGEGQGLHSVLPALANNAGDKYQFKIIGDGGRKKQLEQACIGIDNISLLPPVKRAELVGEYLNADVLFLHLNDYPAFKKVLPSKIFEYAAMGKPILAGVQGYSAQFINEQVENAKVFYPNDGKQAALALQSLDLIATNRDGFIRKFARENIMQNMAQSIFDISGTR
ncbi:glycosyltransferase family 4 protein [Catenovulum maritimum]|uniref:Glycosyl transferase family 1 n=1 Tax=Catenovulum maritimum TaxID=1513271 RepID=A0A0J8GTV5_9ALTE|nr:glycosyltransferase family 4 protein [Catenovulum maritimum]KMT64749.1 glycosyl transferase family 1 [Catenovulum maritimum]